MRLPQILDLGAAAPLREALLAARGNALEIDASGVERLGGLCLQVLVSAQRTWSADGAVFRVINASAAFSEAARLMAAPELREQEGGIS
jgi:chemotaxis protein CheX